LARVGTRSSQPCASFAKRRRARREAACEKLPSGNLLVGEHRLDTLRHQNKSNQFEVAGELSLFPPVNPLGSRVLKFMRIAWSGRRVSNPLHRHNVPPAGQPIGFPACPFPSGEAGAGHGRVSLPLTLSGRVFPNL
jgi:hypothetical protein